MDKEIIINELKNIIGDYVRNQGLDLIDLICRYEGRDLILRILVDKPEGGIRLGDCAYLNNEISRILDVKEILQKNYILEVASPGLDRQLKTKNDFLRCIKKQVRFFLNEKIQGKLQLEGVIVRVGEDCVYIELGEKMLQLPLTQISKAKQALTSAKIFFT